MAQNEDHPPAPGDGSEPEYEPQLKYNKLGGDVPNILETQQVSCLCLSDKILALGTEDGRIHVLDYEGNEVTCLHPHQSRINELCFDAAEEHIASASEDESVVISSLFSDAPVRHDFRRAIKTLAIDPRYSSRKTKQIVTAGSGGPVLLSTQGWLGRSDTELGKGEGVSAVRWWGNLIAWASSKAVQVYCTVQYHVIRTFTRPSGTTLSQEPYVSLLFGQNGYLYASWPDCIKVMRTYPVENSVGTLVSQVEIVADIRLGSLVLGVAPFGSDLAVLTYPTSPASSPGQGPSVTPGQQPELRIVTLRGNELACDSLPCGSAEAEDEELQGRGSVGSTGDPGTNEPNTGPTTSPLPVWGPGAYKLVPSLPATTAAATARKLKRDFSQPWALPGWSVLAGGAGGASPAAAGGPAGASPMGGGSSAGLRPPSSGPSAAASQSASPTSTAGNTPFDGSGGLQGGSGGLTSHGGIQHGVGSHGTRSPAMQASAPATPRGGLTSRAMSERGGLVVVPEQPQYAEGADFMYFVVSPKAVLVGRTRDANDRVQWLIGRGRWDAALVLAESAGKEVAPETFEQVVHGYISDLLKRSAYDEAAALSRRLLRQDAALWERFAYLFAQARQLHKLAPYLPTESPRLRTQVYDMCVLALLGSPPDHQLLLDLVRRWPLGLFSTPSLIDAVVGRMKRGGPGSDTRELWLLLSHLYESQGRPDLSLPILLQLRDPSVFTFINSHHEKLLSMLMGPRAVQLIDIDEAAALRLLVRHVDVVTPSHVVPALQEAVLDGGGPGTEGGERWRRLLWRYLAAVFEVDPAASAEFHELQVQLTADYAPSTLLDLLSSSQSVPLEAALAICEAKGLVHEQVFILGRMGNTTQALHLIIDRLGDIPQAIEFVRSQRDDDLWDHLISWALGSPDTTGALLDHLGGQFNPVTLVRRIPSGMAIPRLRDRVRAIISDFRTQTSLHEGCSVILRSDCASLIARLYRSARSAVQAVYVAPQPELVPGGQTLQQLWARYELSTGMLQPLLIPADDSLPSALRSGAATIGVSTGNDLDAGASSTGGAQQQYVAGGYPSGPVGGPRRGGGVGTSSLLQPHIWVGCTSRQSLPEDAAGAFPSGGPYHTVTPGVGSGGGSAGSLAGGAVARQRRQQVAGKAGADRTGLGVQGYAGSSGSLAVARKGQQQQYQAQLRSLVY